MSTQKVISIFLCCLATTVAAASHNVINIDSALNNATIYPFGKYKSNVYFDTTVPWTATALPGTSIQKSLDRVYYRVRQSNLLTEFQQYRDMKLTGPIAKNGGALCLKPIKAEKENVSDEDKYELCVDKFKYRDLYTGSYPNDTLNGVDGILGLGPGGNESFVQQLLAQGKIDKGIVSLDLKTQNESQISFGQIDYEKVKGGKEGMRYFSNVGYNNWALVMSQVQYGPNELKKSDGEIDIIRTKFAVIDSINDFISLPQSYFDSLEHLIKSNEPSVERVKSTNSSEILMIPKGCSEIKNNLENFVFKVENKQFIMQPQSYLHPSTSGEQCYLGFSSIPDEKNQFVLGKYFLHQYYTVLDFENNMIIIGRKTNSFVGLDGQIEPVVEDPTAPKEPAWKKLTTWEKIVIAFNKFIFVIKNPSSTVNIFVEFMKDHF